MSLPFVTLNAATSPMAGDGRDLEKLIRYHTAVVTVTGGSVSMNLTLEGSHDGSGWRQLATIDGSQGGIYSVSEHLVRYIRANLQSLSGGTSPTVTVTIASGDE